MPQIEPATRTADPSPGVADAADVAATGVGAPSPAEPAAAGRLSIPEAVRRGLTGANFNLAANLSAGDTRGIDPAARAVEGIMRARGLGFDYRLGAQA